MSTVVIVVRQPGRECTACRKLLGKNRLYVRAAIGRLKFSCGVFCSIACLARFARRKKKQREDTIRGWTFGEKRGG